MAALAAITRGKAAPGHRRRSKPDRGEHTVRHTVRHCRPTLPSDMRREEFPYWYQGHAQTGVDADGEDHKWHGRRVGARRAATKAVKRS